MKAVIFSFLAFFALAGGAFANESIIDIAKSKAVKEAMIQSLQTRIALHQTLSKEEILADFVRSVDSQAAVLEARGVSGQGIEQFREHADASLEQMKQLDKDGILAVETVDLQNLQTSDDYLFWFTRLVIWDDRHCGDWIGCHIADLGLWLPLALVVDFAGLPFELVFTIVTGF